MTPGATDRTLPGSPGNERDGESLPGSAAHAHSFPFAGIRRAIARITRAPRAPTLAVCLQAYLDDLALRARPRTLQAAELAARRFIGALGDVQADALEPAKVMAWRRARSEQGASNKTINTELGYVLSALGLAVRNGELRANPLGHLRSLPTGARHRKRQPRALSEHELLRLLDAAAALDEELGGFPREPLIRTLAQTGMRWGEATALTWSDFDHEALVLTVRAEESKTGIGRALPIDDDLGDRLQELRTLTAKILGVFPEPGTPIFRTPRGSPWAANCSNFRRHFTEVIRRAGIARKDGSGRVICVHALRHTFATRLARAGISLAQAQILTGHRTPQVLLQIYTHLRAEEARSAIDALRLPGKVGTGSLEEPGGAARTPRPDFSTRRGDGSPGRARTYNPAVNSRRAVDETDPSDPPPAA